MIVLMSLSASSSIWISSEWFQLVHFSTHNALLLLCMASDLYLNARLFTFYLAYDRYYSSINFLEICSGIVKLLGNSLILLDFTFKIH